MRWIETGTKSAEQNMERDRLFLENLGQEEGLVLHLYGWEKPAATYGHFIKPADFLVEKEIDLARRPTGGGIVFHLTDLAFSVLVPAHHPSFSENTMENYAFINNRVIVALGGGELLPVEPTPLDEASRHFCMAKPTRYDVMMEGKKVGGAAQRRTKAGYLHQGTIFLRKPPLDFLQRVLLPGSRVLEAMEKESYPLADESSLEETRSRLKQRLVEVFSAH